MLVFNRLAKSPTESLFSTLYAASIYTFNKNMASDSFLGAILLLLLCFPVIISFLKYLKNFLPLSLIKKVINMALNQQFDNNCLGGTILLHDNLFTLLRFESKRRCAVSERIPTQPFEVNILGILFVPKIANSSLLLRKF